MISIADRYYGTDLWNNLLEKISRHVSKEHYYLPILNLRILMQQLWNDFQLDIVLQSITHHPVRWLDEKYYQDLHRR